MKGFSKLAIVFILTMVNGEWSMAQPFTHADTLRGSNGPGRDWWDVLKYDLHVKFNLEDSTISGWNTIYFKVLKEGGLMQIDLQEPLILDSVSVNNTGYEINKKFQQFQKDRNVYFINMPYFKKLSKSYYPFIKIFYHGKPKIAKKAPWDGGLIWKKDREKSPWVSIACQGLGASVWYPCKDYQGDEPDSAEIHITIPDSLVCVGNGRFRGKATDNNGSATYDWAVTNPINNYNIIPYIGKYVHFSEIYKGELGNLDMDYWVLDSNLTKAKEQFKDAPKMMKAFEYWFGPYPFYKDGYKLVDAPHLGMEHQSAIGYGNGYRNGYKGTDRSASGWGLKFDFIIVHESGHEWFGNNITTKDIADMWVHESFTNYSETLFTEYYYGKEAATAYITGLRKIIKNDTPIIAPYGVNREGSGDMYDKGANMIHTIRQVINNDGLFRKILRGLNKTFYHQTVTGKQIQQYINKQSRINFDKVFQQYLTTIQIPVLEYKLDGYKLQFRYSNCIKDFNLPLKINFKGTRWIKPTQQWQTLSVYPEGDSNFSVDSNFYINTKKVE
ncbi:MAG: M1 family metallopeptidase [Chitinophagaceae bacterium]|nr:M1 family metallopeptidase [Chitinophagaceae bacterium]